MSLAGTIVILDGDSDFCRFVQDAILPAGFSLAVATDADDAKIRLQSGEVDSILADSDDHSAFELVRNLHTFAEGMLAVLVAENPSLDTALEAASLPVVGFFRKPLDSKTIVEAVTTATTHFHAYKQAKDTRKRMSRMAEELAEVAEITRASQTGGRGMPVATYLDLTMRNIVLSLLDVRRVADALISTDQHEACNLFDCPKSTAMEAAIKKTIGTLENTKHAFRSKELGILRKELEETLERWESP